MDTAFGLFFQGYPSLIKKFRGQQRDVLETNLLPFMKAIAIRGEEAARLFYDEHKFVRRGDTPHKTTQDNFTGRATLQAAGIPKKNNTIITAQIPGEASLNRLEYIFKQQWQASQEQWQTRNGIILFNEAEKVLCVSACQWLGIPLHEQDENLRTSQLSILIDADGAVGPRYIRGRTCRKKLEMWLALLTEDLRGGRLNAPKDSIFQSMAFRKDTTGNIINARTIATELLNLIRPVVAVARHITFAALALYEHPHYTVRLKADASLYVHFAHEVRRYYPFSPIMAAKVRSPFEFDGIKFDKGVLVMLDIYATNHHENAWKNPGAFYPERFENWDNKKAFNFILQGSNAININHKCTGEWVTTRLTTTALQLLNENMQYTVPDQDLTVDISRLPVVPQSRFKIKMQPV